MKLPDWETQFQPITRKRGWGMREGQRQLGDAFIKALNTKTDLLGEAGTGTGKSMVAAVPIIHAIHQAKATGRTYRGIISTETITLQDQIVNKDLPDLAAIYGGFTYKKLMGRSNYLCLDSAHEQVVGSVTLNNLYMRLEGAASRLTTGEKSDCEAIVGREIQPDEWEQLTGSAEFCADNACTPEEGRCFGARARSQALGADIVVCNHALLATDVEAKTRITSLAGAMEPSEGILGPYNALVVDEGHRLAPVFASQLTETVNGYEIFMMGKDIITGVEECQKLDPTLDGNEIVAVVDDTQRIMELIVMYYKFQIDKWDGHEAPLVYRRFATGDGAFITGVMGPFENTVVNRLTHNIEVLEAHVKKSERVLKNAPEPKKWAKSRKGVRKATKLAEVSTVIRDSLLSTEGIVNSYGMYGVSLQGYTSNDGTPRANIYLEPLDVKHKTKILWAEAETSLLMSATLADPTHNDPWKFIRDSLGFSETAPVIRVASSFDMSKQQLVYITPANAEPEETTRYNFDELFNMTQRMQGRSLLLFTARSDLELAATKFRLRQAQGQFPYKILVQEKDSDKKRLAEEFKNDTNAILLGLDSFMTGFDAPGETLTHVAVCKFPLPRYNAQMKQKIAYWRTRGFPNFYQREALMKFEQAAGRLIRSDDCRGVLSIMDQAVMDGSSSVYKTAKLGMGMLGSPFTQDQGEVERFIYGAN